MKKRKSNWGTYQDIPYWLYRQLSKELGIPEVVINNAPRAIQAIEEFVNGLPFDPFGKSNPKRVKPTTDAPDFIPNPTPEKPEEPKTQKRYSNMGGLYTGKFKYPKRKPNVYNGITFKREDGYNITDDSGGVLTTPVGAVWTGVTCLVWSQFQRNVLLAILRKLCASKGYEFNHSDDKIGDTIGTVTGGNAGVFHYLYRPAGNNTAVERTIDIAAGAKWEDLANDWVVDMDNTFSTFQQVKFDKCWILANANDVGNVTTLVPVMSLNMNGLKIKYKATHTLYVQNRTRDTGGGDGIDTVDANPIMGRIYIINGSHVQTSTPIEFGGTWGTPNDNSGRVNISPQGWTTNSDGQQLFARLVPKATFEGCYRTARIRLQPGEIKKASVTMTDFLPFDTLFWKAFLPAHAGLEDVPIRYGKTMVLGFQKVVRTSTADTQAAFDSRLQIACTNRQFHTIEAIAVRKQPFIARNNQPEVL